MIDRRIGLEVSRNGQRVAAIRIAKATTRIGRMVSADLRLDHPDVSRVHCILEVPPLEIVDLGGSSGTYVNGERLVASRRRLQLGDTLTVGPFRIVVVDGDAIAAPVERSFASIVDAILEPAGEPPPAATVPPASSAALPDALAYLEALPAVEVAPVVAVPTPGAPVPFDDDGLVDTLRGFDAQEREMAEHIGVLAMVGIDKLRAQRGQATELGQAYDAALGFFGTVRIARAAPSLLIELVHGMPELEVADWRIIYCASIAHNDAVWPHLEAVANLPGFARGAALAAVGAGRDPLPWLRHPFHELRIRAAKLIRDPDERMRALASIAASFGSSDVQSELTVEPAAHLELPSLAPLVDGLWSPCADHRAWTISAVAERGDPRDALVLAVADALDAARAGTGWPRTAVDWDDWDDVPGDPTERDAWICARIAGRTDLPAEVLAYAAHGAPDFGPPRLEVSEEALEAIHDNERCELLAALTELEELAKRLKNLREPP